MESHTHTYTYSPSPMTLVSVRSLIGILSDFGRLASSMPMEEGGGGVPDPTSFITVGRERKLGFVLGFLGARSGILPFPPAEKTKGYILL